MWIPDLVGESCRIKSSGKLGKNERPGARRKTFSRIMKKGPRMKEPNRIRKRRWAFGVSTHFSRVYESYFARRHNLQKFVYGLMRLSFFFLGEMMRDIGFLRAKSSQHCSQPLRERRIKRDVNYQIRAAPRTSWEICNSLNSRTESVRIC